MSETEAQKRYRLSDKGIAVRKRAEKKRRENPDVRARDKAKEKVWRESEKGRAKIKEWLKSEKGIESHAKHNQSEARKISYARYARSDKGKKARRNRDARSRAKRKRDLGFNPINRSFPGSHGHHFNKEDVLFIPGELHKSVPHRQDNPESMKIINDAAFEWLCTQEVL